LLGCILKSFYLVTYFAVLSILNEFTLQMAMKKKIIYNIMVLEIIVKTEQQNERAKNENVCQELNPGILAPHSDALPQDNRHN